MNTCHHLLWLNTGRVQSLVQFVIQQPIFFTECSRLCGCVYMSVCSLYVYLKHLKRKLYVCDFAQHSVLKISDCLQYKKITAIYFHHTRRERGREKKKKMLSASPSLSKCRAFWVANVTHRQRNCWKMQQETTDLKDLEKLLLTLLVAHPKIKIHHLLRLNQD